MGKLSIHVFRESDSCRDKRIRSAYAENCTWKL